MFEPIYGGDPILYQHLFWIFGHPEVYILIIPIFGIITISISINIIIYIFGHISMIIAIINISIIGNIVWAHHMFTSGIINDTKIYFQSITMIIAIPTGNKLFNWIITIIRTNQYNQYQYNNIITYFISIFIIMFIIGGTSGILIAITIIDISLHDTYYIINHFHFVLSLGAITSIFII